MEKQMEKLFVQREEKWREVCEKDYRISEAAGVWTYPRGMVLPIRKEKKAGILDYISLGGACDEAGRFVGGWTRKLGGEMNKSCLRAYAVPEKELRTVPETAVFGGVVDGHFGHFISEGLSRLWWVVQHPDEYDRLVFAITTAVPDWMNEMYRLLGIPAEKVEYVEAPTRYKRLIVPDETMYLWSGYRGELNLVYDTIRERLPKSPYEKVYFTRTQFEKHDCLNENYFENYFRNQGYHVAAPERLPIAEQFALAAGAKEIACCCGTLSHFALFSAPGTRLVILNRTTDHFLVPQIVINRLRRIDATLVDVSRNYLPVRHNRGCFLLESTPCWNRYLESVGQEPVELTEEERAKNAYLFLRSWHDNYLKENAFSTLQDFDTADVLDYMDRALDGSGVERKAYQAGERRSGLLKKLKQAEKEKERYRLTAEATGDAKEKLSAAEAQLEIRRLRHELELMQGSWKQKIKSRLAHMYCSVKDGK